jgi:hypothetical protein
VDDEGMRLPAGAVLVHIGPYKTGSTAIQTTLALHREDMAPHGVLYPGEGHRQMRPTWALIERGAAGVGPVPMTEWDDLSAEVRSAVDQRVVISSEDLASAGVEQARKLAADLGTDRVHVLIVVRRLDRLFPSSWQERVKSWNETRTYDEWLREVLDEDRSGAAGSTFWRNHGIANLLAVWGAAVPPERIVLLVADEADRGRSPRTFEALLGLPPGLLTPGPRENTSLSMDKIELYRQVNQLFKDHDWSARHRRELLYRGMLRGLRQVPPNALDVPIPELPTWAADRVRELSSTRARHVARHPGTVVGDPELLTEVDVGSDEEFAAVPDRVPMETAVAAIEAVLTAGIRLERSRRRSRPPAPSAPPSAVPSAAADPLEEVGTRRQLSGPLRRVASRFGRRT